MVPNTIGLPRYATFETGANAGRTVGVKSWTQAIRRLELWAPTGLPVAVGDQLRIYPGCHKRVLEDCRDRSGTSSTGDTFYGFRPAPRRTCVTRPVVAARSPSRRPSRS